MAITLKYFIIGYEPAVNLNYSKSVVGVFVLVRQVSICCNAYKLGNSSTYCPLYILVCMLQRRLIVQFLKSGIKASTVN